MAANSVPRAVEQQRAEVAQLFANAFRRTGNTASTAAPGISPASSNWIRGTGVVDPSLSGDSIIPNLDPALAAQGSTRSLAGQSARNSVGSILNDSSTLNIQRDLTTDNLRAFDQGVGRETGTVQGESDLESIELITGECYSYNVGFR